MSTTVTTLTGASAPEPARASIASHFTGLRPLRSPKVLTGLVILGFFGVLAVIGPWIAPYQPDFTNLTWVRKVCVDSTCSISYPVPLSPSGQHWLGTTLEGNDVWSQLLWSTRATLVVGFVAGAVATLLAVLVGVSAGYLGGSADEGLSLFSNVFLAIPGLPLLIVLASYTPGADTNPLLIALIVSVTGWAWGARVLRAQTLSLRNRDFVEAARVSGEGRGRIILSEVLPNLTPIVAASFLFTTLYAIGAYIALSFLGLAGTQIWNWGLMMYWAQAQSAVISGWWWWWVPPGLCIALLGTGLALVNFGIDEFINPRLRLAGVSRKAARTAGMTGRQTLGFTPVLRHGTTSVRPVAKADQQTAADEQTAVDAVLEIRGLNVDYGYGEGAVHAVRDCNLTLRRGQVLGLAGESGSGKSTLAMAAIRLLRAPGLVTSGEVLFHSKPTGGRGVARTVDLLAAGHEELRSLRWSEIAVVVQSALNALNPVATVGSQIDDVLRAHRSELTRSQRRARGAELLTMVGMTGDRLRSYPHELSGGMRQRAMIAMALALDPQVMIMDEPTTALDVVTQREILEELMGLRDRLGFAALFITHDLSLLVELADEIAVMYAGRLVERATAPSLFSAPRHPYTHGLLNCFPPMHGERGEMKGIPGSPPDLRALPLGCAFHPRCPWAMAHCQTELPVLETIQGAGRSTRQVACWLQQADAPVPAELAIAEPAARHRPAAAAAAPRSPQ